MAHIYTEEENKTYHARLPRKTIFVKLIAKSADKSILLVKPNYKKTWQLPGGGVDEKEEPKEALARELHEELGLELAEANIKIVGTVFRREHDALILIYELAGTVDSQAELRAAEDEIEAYKFIAPFEVAPLMGDYYHKFWADYLAK